MSLEFSDIFIALYLVKNLKNVKTKIIVNKCKVNVNNIVKPFHFNF